jgi:hypothetical protein
VQRWVLRSKSALGFSQRSFGRLLLLSLFFAKELFAFDRSNFLVCVTSDFGLGDVNFTQAMFSSFGFREQPIFIGLLLFGQTLWAPVAKLIGIMLTARGVEFSRQFSFIS